MVDAGKLTTSSTHEWRWHSGHSYCKSAFAPALPSTKRTWRWKSWHPSRHAHRRPHARHSTHRSSWEAAAQVRLEQRVGLSFCVVCIRNAVDDLLRLVARYLLVVCLHVAQVVAAVIVRFPHAHRVVCKVDIAVVAEELRHDAPQLDHVLEELCSGHRVMYRRGVINIQTP